jgi:L-ascorbate metabolism protein UlaG (beta-lactamase superfamily)
MIKKTSKVIAVFLLGTILILIIVVTLFVNNSPEFGNSPSDEDLAHFQNLEHYKGGKFINLIPTSMDMSLGDMASTLIDFIKGTPNGKPDFELSIVKVDSTSLATGTEATKLVWFGHSAFLLQLDGKNILLDPMFGDVPAPHPLLGNRRYSELPIEIEKLPAIDAIILSHDHYDHLDYGSIQKLKRKTKTFYVPLGVGAHLRSWGIPAEAIHELNWWDEIDHDSIKLAFAPSRHFSGRGMTDRSSTLWGSWIIKGKKDNIYFSGDGGYGPHFKEIGVKYGPFDFAMIECGQYNEKWSLIHMMPEESAQAAVDVNARLMMPIHWGAFTLALHPWTEPVERVTDEASKLNMPIKTPRIGEFIYVNDRIVTSRKWWVKKQL